MNAAPDSTALAIAAAHQAAFGTAELLSAVGNLSPEDTRANLATSEALELLADALKMAIEAADPEFADEDRRQLHGALVRFLQGWAG
jgi:hypothetical protein